jgi:hypothetical protein
LRHCSTLLPTVKRHELQLNKMIAIKVIGPNVVIVTAPEMAAETATGTASDEREARSAAHATLRSKRM